MSPKSNAKYPEERNTDKDGKVHVFSVSATAVTELKDTDD